MNAALWVGQILLALVFAISGAMKALGSKKWIVESGQTGVFHYSVPFIRFIALCELLGAVGLIAPFLRGIAPLLTPIAAACLGVIMIGAARAHSRLFAEHRGDIARRRKESFNVATNIVLLVICAFIVAGRTG